MITDTTAPQVASFSFDVDAGRLTLVFNEPVKHRSLKTKETVTLRNAGGTVSHRIAADEDDVLVEIQVHHPPARIRWQLGEGLKFQQGLVGFNLVAFCHQHAHHISLLYVFTEIRDN